MDRNTPKHYWGRGLRNLFVLNWNSDILNLWGNKTLNWMSCESQLYCHLSFKFSCLQFVRQCNKQCLVVCCHINDNYAADNRILLQGWLFECHLPYYWNSKLEVSVLLKILNNSQVQSVFRINFLHIFSESISSISFAIAECFSHVYFLLEWQTFEPKTCSDVWLICSFWISMNLFPCLIANIFTQTHHI